MTYVVEKLNGEEIVETFYEKILHKTNQIVYNLKCNQEKRRQAICQMEML